MVKMRATANIQVREPRCNKHPYPSKDELRYSEIPELRRYYLARCYHSGDYFVTEIRNDRLGTISFDYGDGKDIEILSCPDPELANAYWQVMCDRVDRQDVPNAGNATTPLWKLKLGEAIKKYRAAEKRRIRQFGRLAVGK